MTSSASFSCARAAMRRACSSEVSVGERPFEFARSLATLRGRLRVAVDAEALDLPCDLGRDEVVDRLACRDPGPDLAGRDRPLLDPQHLDVPLGRLEPRPGTDDDPGQPAHLARFPPAREALPLVAAENEVRAIQLCRSQEVHRERMVVEPYFAEPPQRDLGQVAADLRVCDDALVAGPLGDQDEQPLGAELIPGALRERDVAEMRRVEHAAENCGGHERISVSPSTSTSAPVFAPAARKAY